VVPIGGPQSLTLAEIAQITLSVTKQRRRFVRVPSSLTRQIAGFLARFRGSLTEHEIDALSYNRTTEIGSVHRTFGFAPAKMPTKLSYLKPNQERPPLPVRFTNWPEYADH
jgi:hypothetical protein